MVHDLLEMLVTVLSGGEGCTYMADFAHTKLEYRWQGCCVARSTKAAVVTVDALN